MNDRAVSLLEQYEVEVLGTRKGRGAIICDTDRGCLIFKEYSGSDESLNLQYKLLNHINECGQINAETIIPSRDGSLSVKDMDGVQYFLKSYTNGRECNITDREECLSAVKTLAQLHKCVGGFDNPGVSEYCLEREFEKRNKELKRVRRFLKMRSQKTDFEIKLQGTYDYFMERAFYIEKEWADYSSSVENDSRTNCIFCHGDYQYHNILLDKDRWFVINFEKTVRDNPMRDLYLLVRKLLEKSNWSSALGTDLIEEYNKVINIDDYSRKYLFYKFSYPEKFWKIVNFYYNSGKAWIPEKNTEKLNIIIKQEDSKDKFLREVLN